MPRSPEPRGSRPGRAHGATSRRSHGETHSRIEWHPQWLPQATSTRHHWRNECPIPQWNHALLEWAVRDSNPRPPARHSAEVESSEPWRTPQRPKSQGFRPSEFRRVRSVSDRMAPPMAPPPGDAGPGSSRGWGRLQGGLPTHIRRPVQCVARRPGAYQPQLRHHIWESRIECWDGRPVSSQEIGDSERRRRELR